MPNKKLKSNDKIIKTKIKTIKKNNLVLYQEKILKYTNIINIPLLTDNLLEHNDTSHNSVNITYKKFNVIPNNDIILKKTINQCDKIKTKQYFLLFTDYQKIIINSWFDGYIELYNIIICHFKNIIKIEKNKQYPKQININDIPNINEELNINLLRKKYYDAKQIIQKKYNKMNMHILDYAISDCIAMIKSKISNIKNGNIKKSRLREIKKTKQNKIIKIEQQLCTENSFCTSMLGKNIESKPKLKYDESKIVRTLCYNEKDNKYFMMIRSNISQEELDKYKVEKKNKIISLDPGIRVLFTGIVDDKIIEIGKNVTSEIRTKLIKINEMKKVNNENNQLRKEMGYYFVKTLENR